MDLRLLESFHAVLEKGSLNAAAVELGYAQSTLTQQIRELERRLGVQLFERHGKRLRISPAGMLLQERSVSLLQRASELDRFFEDVAKGSGGALRIASVEPFATKLVSVVKPILNGTTSLEITIEVHGAHSAYSALERGLVDFAIAPASAHRTGIAFEPLYFESVGFLLPRAHKLARMNSVELVDIVGESLVLSASECEYRRALEQAAVAAGVPLRSQLAVGSIEGRKRATLEGLGISIVPTSASKPLPKELVFRRPKNPPVGITLGIVTRTGAGAPAKHIQRVIEAIRAHDVTVREVAD